MSKTDHPNGPKPAALSGRSRTALYCCVIAGITAVAFLPSLENGFTNWDDDAYVVDNPDVKGFTPHHLAKIFSSDYLGNYQPVPMLAYMAEYTFFRLGPSAYHFINLLLHCINCLLVFALIYGLSGNRFTSLLVGLLFAVHPLRVESVAWIAEQKDLLSSFFYFLSLLAYLRFIKNRGRKMYWCCLFSLLLSLLSKPMAVSQPFVLLLIDYVSNRKIDKKVLLEKFPFFCAIVVFAALAILTQKGAGPVSDVPALSLVQRMCVPFYGIVFYLVKAIAPVHLCAYYSVPAVLDAGMNLKLLASPFLVIGCAATVYYCAVKAQAHRKLVFGSLFFLITALPILQIVPVGGVMVAERYTYIPMIGIGFLFVETGRYLLREKFRNNSAVKFVGAAGMIAVIAVLAFMTHGRCAVWNNSISLWSDVIAECPGPIAYTNRGTAYNTQGNYDRAIEDYSHAIMLNPRYALAYTNRGVAYKAKGDYRRAIDDHNTAIMLNPGYAQAYNNRGVAYYANRDNDRAIEDYTQAIVFNPHYAQAYNNRGVAFCYKREYDRAIEDFTQAVRLNPQYIEVYYNRGLAYKANGDVTRALDDIRKACESGLDAACKLLAAIESRGRG